MKIEERIEGLLNEGNNPNTFIKGVNIQINKLENETEKLRKTFFNNLKKVFSGVPDKETFEFIIKNLPLKTGSDMEYDIIEVLLDVAGKKNIEVDY